MYVVTFRATDGSRQRILVRDYGIPSTGDLQYERPDGRRGALADGCWLQVQEASPGELETLADLGELSGEDVRKAMEVGDAE